MSEVEKQEGQKTVVAFITGLLIGGLLVWVFSSSPEKIQTETETDTAVTEITDDSDASTEGTTSVSDVKTNDAPKATVVVGNGSLTVTNQDAGDTVVLTKVSYPEKSGWIVVSDYAGGAPGNILGAARYNLDDELTPESVSLVRKTVAGSSYQVMFYTDNDDKSFSVKDDMPVSGGESTFKAN